MITVLRLIFNELIFEVYKFLKFWFYDSLKFLFNEYIKSALSIEKRFSIRLNLKHFFEPLYGIKSIETYFYAIPLRIILIFISIFLHIFNTLIFLIIMLFWVLFPFVLSYFVYRKNGI